MISVILLREVLLQGSIMALVTIAAFLTSRVARIDDLTIEGSFGAGGALIALLVNYHWPLMLGLPGALVLGACLGFCTSFLHEYIGINKVLSGLCITAITFSINLALVGAYAAIPANVLVKLCGVPMIVIVMSTALLGYGSIALLLQTTLGSFLFASGSSPLMVFSVGRNPALFKGMTLALANGLAGLAGALFVFHTGFFSITGNMGILISALSGLLLGSLLNSAFSLWLLAGAVLQQSIFALIINLGISPVWNNAGKAVLIILLVVCLNMKSQRKSC